MISIGGRREKTSTGHPAKLTQRPHIHRIHARIPDRLHPQVRVLITPAQFRVNPDPSRRFQKNIRRGLLIYHHLARHHGGKQVADLQMLQHITDNLLRAAGGDGCPDATTAASRSIDADLTE